MAENQTLKERLLIFINEIGLSVNAFEKQCGLSQGYVKNIGQSLPSDKLGKISKAFPALSQSWLMFGIGSMYYNDNDLAVDRLREKANSIGDNSSHNTQSIGSPCSTCPFTEQLAEKDRQIAKLQDMINKLMEKI